MAAAASVETDLALSLPWLNISLKVKTYVFTHSLGDGDEGESWIVVSVLPSTTKGAGACAAHASNPREESPPVSDVSTDLQGSLNRRFCKTKLVELDAGEMGV